jgi:hypothetical protein
MQEGVPPCKSGMAQEEHRQEEVDQSQRWARDLESTDTQGDNADAPWRQKGSEGPKLVTAALTEETTWRNYGRKAWKILKRLSGWPLDWSSWSDQPGCPVSCGKWGTGQYGGVGPRYKLEEPTSSVSARRAGYVGAPADLGNFTPTCWKKEGKPWMMERHLDLLHLSNEPLGASGLEEGTAVALGELTPWEEIIEQREGRWDETKQRPRKGRTGGAPIGQRSLKKGAV